MKKFLLVSSLIAVTTVSGFSTLANAAAAVPCEDVLATLNDGLTKAKLSDADAKAEHHECLRPGSNPASSS